MSQPIAYVPAYNFTGFQTANPATPLPADKLDTELAALKITTDSVRVNMALLQADDGTLKTQVVTPVSLTTSTLALLSSTGLVRGAWVTATVYAAKDIVTQGSGTYICAVAHTSGVFATDLTAVKWVLLAGSTGSATLASLADCTITTPATNQGLYYNGTKWVNGTLVAANVTDGVLTFAKMAAAFSNTSTTLAGASNTNVPTTTAIKTYVDTQISRGTGTPVASATTTSLTGTYDYAHITGTTTITGITLATDEEVWVVFDGILTLTHNSVALILPGATNITTAAGDRAKLRGIDGTNVICLDYVKASGQAVVASQAGVVSVKKQIFTSSGTYTPSSGMLYCIVEMVDGGCGGGGVKLASAANAGAGGGGPGGTYSRSVLTAAQVGASQTVTIGAAGAAGDATGSNGAAGGNSSLGALVTSTGTSSAGSGSTNGSATEAQQAVNASSAGTADLRVRGGKSSVGWASTAASTFNLACAGGDSLFGVGGVAWSVVAGSSHSGAAGQIYGGGGGGALVSGSTTGQAGGAGAVGVMFITEFCSQ